jgi:hypothetical protein
MAVTISGTTGVAGNVTGNLTGNASTATLATLATNATTAVVAGSASNIVPASNLGLATCKAWVNFNGIGTLNGTYVQSGGLATVTFSQTHGLPIGTVIYFGVTSGGAPSGDTGVTSIPSPTQIVVGTSGGTYSGNVTITSAFIRSSYNVSSITKTGVGNYRVNTLMSDANYAVNVTSNQTTYPDWPVIRVTSQSTTGAQVQIGNRINGNLAESTDIHVTIFGN